MNDARPVTPVAHPRTTASDGCSLDTARAQQEARDVRIALLERLLGKWVSYLDLSGVQPVSGDIRDNPVLTLLRDSREALKKS